MPRRLNQNRAEAGGISQLRCNRAPARPPPDTLGPEEKDTDLAGGDPCPLSPRRRERSDRTLVQVPLRFPLVSIDSPVRYTIVQCAGCGIPPYPISDRELPEPSNTGAAGPREPRRRRQPPLRPKFARLMDGTVELRRQPSFPLGPVNHAQPPGKQRCHVTCMRAFWLLSSSPLHPPAVPTPSRLGPRLRSCLRRGRTIRRRTSARSRSARRARRAIGKVRRPVVRRRRRNRLQAARPQARAC